MQRGECPDVLAGAQDFLGRSTAFHVDSGLASIEIVSYIYFI
jgi:hypothetical protein